MNLKAQTLGGGGGNTNREPEEDHKRGRETI